MMRTRFEQIRYEYDGQLDSAERFCGISRWRDSYCERRGSRGEVGSLGRKYQTGKPARNAQR